MQRSQLYRDHLTHRRSTARCYPSGETSILQMPVMAHIALRPVNLFFAAPRLGLGLGLVCLAVTDTA